MYSLYYQKRLGGMHRSYHMLSQKIPVCVLYNILVS